MFQAFPGGSRVLDIVDIVGLHAVELRFVRHRARRMPRDACVWRVAMGEG